MSSLAEINRRNREFWNARQALAATRMADAAICDTAFEIILAQQNKGVPGNCQTSHYEALEIGERAKKRCLSQQARKGGIAERMDALQELIEEFVNSNPTLTARQLEDKLRANQDIEPIQDVDDEVVSFTTSDGRTKKAMLSGLKHRLTRARKKTLRRRS